MKAMTTIRKPKTFSINSQDHEGERAKNQAEATQRLVAEFAKIHSEQHVALNYSIHWFFGQKRPLPPSYDRGEKANQE